MINENMSDYILLKKENYEMQISVLKKYRHLYVYPCELLNVPLNN